MPKKKYIGMPNGFGGICRMGGNRRKPWAVRITVGWSDEGKQLYKYIGYYEDRMQALEALITYNKNPYDIDAAKVTFAEIFEKWSEKKFPKISRSNIAGYNASYKCCTRLYNMRFCDIKSEHLQGCIDDSGKNYPTRKKIKILFNQLYAYALEKDIVSKNYSDFVDLGKKEETETKKPFTQAEIDILWENEPRFPWIDSVLFMIYTGIRIGEFLDLKNVDINFEEQYLRGGSKTEAGKNRIIPIHPRIMPFVKRWYDQKNEYLITVDGKALSYYTYRDGQFRRIMEQLGMEHKPHECRHTFATLMDNAGANKICIKRIMGHSSKDITDQVYTHKDILQLREAVKLLT